LYLAGNNTKCEGDKKQEHQILLQLLLIVGSFVLGYFPVSGTLFNFDFLFASTIFLIPIYSSVLHKLLTVP